MTSKLQNLSPVAGALIVAAMIATLAIFGPAASASLDTLTRVEEAYDTMGTNGDEWSGATYNAERHKLLVVDDNGIAFEFPLDADTNRVISSQFRRIDIDINDGDFEGVTWISGDTYGLLHEDSGRIYVVDITQSTTRVTPDDAIEVVSTGVGTNENLGAEGLATDGRSFYVAKEFPPALHQIAADGTWQGSVSLTSYMADISGVAIAADGSFLVLSDQSRTITNLTIDFESERVDSISRRDLGTFGQAEGVAVIDNHTLYVFGERSNQTYGHWEGDVVELVVEPVYIPGDANCSGDIGIDDAYLISRVAVQLEEANEDCSADVNGDGLVNILDAYAAAQCSVDLPACPADMSGSTDS